MKFKSLVIVVVLAMSSTSFADYSGVAAGPKAPCPKKVAHIIQGIQGTLTFTSPAQQQLNNRTLASYSSPSARQKAAAVQDTGSLVNGKSTK